ncbi:MULTISPECIES: NUDIX hydrolase [Thermaerobacter]|uniref:NUDIX hydrolase n=1 Tax=Thermaerobacter composti TaxID=554949 RepID=A0ABZ0QTS0_9FIRM|nr:MULTISPECIES: NUDIX hydrolase [Thermaerobacter]PZN06666.1 MAG: ADP-ribose pyrophosphatase [Bacillota bacterium]QBS37955.1 NUDIX hydrolase [Thermaerobacter sp. FW80]WPD20122.1 NUDIX hydrolase [Thermaerobacter composti]
MERPLHTETVWTGRVFDLRRATVRLEDGREAQREWVEHPGSVVIAAVTAAREVLLVRQYRLPAGRELWELPAGRREPGEDPLAGARRELEEETGYRARTWRLLARCFASPGYTSEHKWLFLAQDLERGARHPDPDEAIAVRAVPLAEAMAMAERGEILDAKTLLGLLILERGGLLDEHGGPLDEGGGLLDERGGPPGHMDGPTRA